MIQEIFMRYDTDCSGALSRNETLKFLNDFLKEYGRPSATIHYFNKYFSEIDVNGDGVVSM
jgi:Ca2+-binding EF-hand superfamily protein